MSNLPLVAAWKARQEAALSVARTAETVSFSARMEGWRASQAAAQAAAETPDEPDDDPTNPSPAGILPI